METSSYQRRFRNLEGKPERKILKRTISNNLGLGGNKGCQSQTEGGVRWALRGVNYEWIVRSHISGKNEIFLIRVWKSFSLVDTF